MRELNLQEVDEVSGAYGDPRFDVGLRQLWNSFGGRGISYASQAYQFSRFTGLNVISAFTAGYAVGTIAYNSYVQWKYY